VKPAVVDPLPLEIEILRSRRRTVELRLENGRLVARVPLRISRRELDRLLPSLRERLWKDLSKRRVFDDHRLGELAARVARERLGELLLPPFTVRFSRRQHKRWGSCTLDRRLDRGSIRISERLRGHPTWVLEHLLLHELIHLRVPNHGPRFQALLRRCPHRDRAEAYLEALESVGLLGLELPEGARLLRFARAEAEEEISGTEAPPVEDLPLFSAVPATPRRPSTR